MVVSTIKTPLRVGVIGVGFGQQVHVPVFRANPRCQVVAICASNIERAQKVAQALEIEKYFGDWQQILHNGEIDAISIAVPPYLQDQIVLETLKLGKPVFCEKPLSTSVQNARLMAAEAQTANLANLVDFEFPEIPQWQRAKEIINSGSLGNLHNVSIIWHVETYANRMGIKSWKTSNEQGGGALNSFVSHCFYYVEWLLGPIRKLSATFNRSPIDKRDGDTTALLHLVLDSGVVVAINVCTNAILGSVHRLEFYGDKATLLLNNQTKDYINGFQLLFGNHDTKELLADTQVDDWHDDSTDGRIRAVSPIVNRFVDWALGGLPATPNFDDGLRVQQLIEAARNSALSERWISCQREK
jgi:predicted dehydrogenase